MSPSIYGALLIVAGIILMTTGFIVARPRTDCLTPEQAQEMQSVIDKQRDTIEKQSAVLESQGDTIRKQSEVLNLQQDNIRRMGDMLGLSQGEK